MESDESREDIAIFPTNIVANTSYTPPFINDGTFQYLYCPMS